LIPYWLLYFGIAVLAYGNRLYKKGDIAIWYTLGVLLILLVAFRFEVGGDWFNYIRHYEKMEGMGLREALALGDPAHQYLNWLSYQYGLGVYGVNFVYGVIFTIGLIRFARLQPYAWIAVLVAIPYLFTVVVMGYSRQGAAIGFFLIALSYLHHKKLKHYIVLVFVATLFHKTALLMLPLGLFLEGRLRWFHLLMVVPVVYAAWDLLFAAQQEELWTTYVEKKMESEGALIRVMMNFVPGLLLLLYRKEWKNYFDDYYFWLIAAFGSLGSLLIVQFASTAVDRIALYLIPLQLVVFARLPLLANKHFPSSAIKGSIIAYYGLVYFVWLFFAAHSQYWTPYQNTLFMSLFE